MRKEINVTADGQKIVNIIHTPTELEYYKRWGRWPELPEERKKHEEESKQRFRELMADDDGKWPKDAPVTDYWELIKNGW